MRIHGLTMPICHSAFEMFNQRQRLPRQRSAKSQSWTRLCPSKPWVFSSGPWIPCSYPWRCKSSQTSDKSIGSSCSDSSSQKKKLNSCNLKESSSIFCSSSPNDFPMTFPCSAHLSPYRNPTFSQRVGLTDAGRFGEILRVFRFVGRGVHRPVLAQWPSDSASMMW